MIHQTKVAILDWQYSKSFFWSIIEIDINFYNFKNRSFLIVICDQKWLQESISEYDTFKPFKTAISSTLSIRWCQRYRCELEIAIFAKRVTWNYAYSPFNLSIQYFFAKLIINLLSRKMLYSKNIVFVLLPSSPHPTYTYLQS